MRQINIFYADDDEDDLMFFNEAIEKLTKELESDIVLHIHKNGDHLIENIKKYKDNNGVAFLDINMPLKTGFELLEEIRNESDINSFPLIMYSTSSNLDNIEKSKTLGANFYVIKPHTFNNLKAILAIFIQIDWKNHKSDPNNFLYK